MKNRKNNDWIYLVSHDLPYAATAPITSDYKFEHDEKDQPSSPTLDDLDIPSAPRLEEIEKSDADREENLNKNSIFAKEKIKTAIVLLKSQLGNLINKSFLT